MSDRQAIPAPEPAVCLSITVNAPDGRSLPTRLVERGVRLALTGEGVVRAEFSVTFLADPYILDLNRRWLDHDWVPDVLSFALHEPGEDPIGDVYIGFDQAARQAEEHGVGLDEELVRLAIHGTLHALGYEHEVEEAARGEGTHFGRQEEILREVLERGSGGGSAVDGSEGP